MFQQILFRKEQQLLILCQQTSSDGGGGTFHPGHPGSPIHRSIPSTQPKQGGSGSYWDWLKSGGGLNPKNPYHPFPGATSPIPGSEII